MNINKIKLKNGKKPYQVYVLYNKRLTELIGSKIKFKFKKHLILNFEFNLI